MKNLKFILILSFVGICNSCPTKFAKELLAKGKITFRDITNLEKHSLSLRSTGT